MTRVHVYKFARGAIEFGKPEAAAAAVICFEWLQRPENVLAGVLHWPDYRSKEWPNAIKFCTTRLARLFGIRTGIFITRDKLRALCQPRASALRGNHKYPKHHAS